MYNSYSKLDFANQMGNIFSQLQRCVRVSKKGEIEILKKYIWRVLEMCEIIKINKPNKEIYRFYEYLAEIWSNPEGRTLELEALVRYSLSFYLADI